MEANEEIDLLQHLERIQEESVAYVQKSVQYYKLLGFRIAMKSTSAFITLIFSLLFLSIFFVFISLAFALYIGELLNSYALGFLCLAGFNMCLFLVVVLFRKRIIEPVVLKIGGRIFYNPE